MSDDIISVPSLAGASSRSDEASALTASENSSTTLEDQLPQFSSLVASMSELWLQQEKKAARSSMEVDAEINVVSNETNRKAITSESDLNLPNRHFHIVTTAALPWFTGTAVNPLLRAAYLHRRTQKISRQDQQWVTLVIPWLDRPEDQKETLGRIFLSPQQQETFIRDWLRHEASMPDAASGLRILFYEARYHSGLGSIFAMGDLLQTIQGAGLSMDVCILEEPEHINWFRAPGDGWTQKYKFVIGVLHTNYKEYITTNGGVSGLWAGPAISLLSSAMVRAYCHKVIKLSAALHDYAPEKEVVCNVHGVRSEFLTEGRRRANECPSDKDEPTPYFIGKMMWAKGLDLLLRLEDYHKALTGEYFPIDIYGKGPEQQMIQKAFQTGSRNRKEHRQTNNNNINGSIIGKTVDIIQHNATCGADNTETASCKSGAASDSSISTSKTSSASKASTLLSVFRENILLSQENMTQKVREPIPCRFPGRVDHLTLKRYKTFVNPSVSEVLCTTTAEALAMGKFVIIPIHPSNNFFLNFPNCLGYRNEFEFVANLHWAQNNEPLALTPEWEKQLSWEAATDRFIDASAITIEEAQNRKQLGHNKLDERIAWFHKELGKGKRGNMLRKLLGGGPLSDPFKYGTPNHYQDETTTMVSDRLTDSDDTASLSSNESMTNDREVISKIGASIDRDLRADDTLLDVRGDFRPSGFSEAVRASLSSLKRTVA